MAIDTVSQRPLPIAGAPAAGLAPGSFFPGCPDLVGSPTGFTRDEEIYGEGEEAEFVYRVVSGAVRTCKILGDGRRQITGFHLPGDLFGFEQGEVHGHNAEAICDTKVMMVRRRQIARVAAERAEVAVALWGLAARDLRRAQEHMLLLGRGSAQERVAAFLLTVGERLGDAGHVALPMTRRDIADYLGLTLETVSRTISQLEGEGALLRAGARQVTLRKGRMRRLVDE
ncbi:transcriptional regulator, Crp/Fnr family [Methylobacterium sp. 4-46]|uniref:helix-turn-helix domain-containing protein n=1 Tax=unclassified Methylobacterium TaxID=2615210 RepID=UPI000152CCA3|nr:MULTISPECIES: helix-turn-helix domain-containing protein [Methylobacterium]ACA20383.1 transcriptional regulator, Crp/Fnr family [Methylobacterium sp. 4-46]WFT79551.1 helix-turn-helix domain-containing protein [Methylobacterium nodulans]